MLDNENLGKQCFFSFYFIRIDVYQPMKLVTTRDYKSFTIKVKQNAISIYRFALQCYIHMLFVIFYSIFCNYVFGCMSRVEIDREKRVCWRISSNFGFCDAMFLLFDKLFKRNVEKNSFSSKENLFILKLFYFLVGLYAVPQIHF